MRRIAFVFVIVAFVSGFACTPGPGPRDPTQGAKSAAGGAKAPVVVTIIVDQLAAWVIDERIDQLPASGGFARLVREGTRVREMRYQHAATDTAPGHSALYSGAVPRESGIFGNETVEDATGKRISILADPRVQLVRASGPVAGSVGSSPSMMSAPSVADALRKAHPDAFIASVSLKDRGAILGAGKSPSACVWYDTANGVWVTSTAFSRELPAWAHMSPLAELPAAWTPLDPAWLHAHTKTPDDQPGEGDYGGLGTTFPHPLTTAKMPNLAFRATPFADEALLELALGALADPRAKGHPTMMAVSLSGNDYVGHVFGPDSWEAWDALLRLDASLARFFGALDTRLGPEGWAVVLSADHGAVEMPEALKACPTGKKLDPWQRPCEGGSRILPDPLAAALEAEAVKLLGPGRWVAGVADPYVYLARAARALEPQRKAELLEALRRALLATPGIRSVYSVADVAAHPCAPESDESEAALVCRSAHVASGDLYMVAHPGSFFDPSVVVGRGTSHGTPYLFDRTVPLFARAPGRVPAGRYITAPTDFRAFAKTASSLLGVDAPGAATSGVDLAAAK